MTEVIINADGKSDEIWKKVVGYDYYEVSSIGRVRSIDKKVRVRGGHNVIKTGRIIVPGTAHGYLSVCLCHNSKKKWMRVHRLVSMAFIPNPENKPFINHKDANRKNNNVQNLEWCTHAENMNHCLFVSENRNIRTTYDTVVYCIKNFNGSNHIELAKHLGIRPGITKRITTESGYRLWIERAKKEIVNGKAVIK